MRLGIKDGKIYDICSQLGGGHKRDNSIPNKDYLDLEMEDWVIGDNWDSVNNVSLKDSSFRNEVLPKSAQELRIDELEDKNTELEARILALEAK